MMAFIVLYFVLFINHNSVYSLEIPIVSDISQVISIARDAQDIANGNYPLKSLLQPSPNPLNVALEKIYNITMQINAFTSTVSNELDNVLETIVRRLPLQGKLDRRMETFNTYIKRIEAIYYDLEHYANNAANFNKRTLVDFVDTVTTLKLGSIPDTLNAIRSIFVAKQYPYIHESIFNLLNKVNKESKPEVMCDDELFQNRLIAIYVILVTCEIKAYVATAFANKYITEEYKVNVSAEMERVEAHLILRIEEYMLEARKELKASSRDIFRCEPPEHIFGETYTGFEGAFLSIAIHSKQFASKSVCKSSCNHATRSMSSHSEYSTPTCKGLVSACEEVDDLDICENPRGNPKFYKFLVNDQYTFGKKTECDHWNKIIVKNSIKFSDHCVVCLCACDQDGGKVNGTYAFNLQPQLADIKNNSIVTNVRFVRENNMIYIQIEESQLLADGKINENSTSWKRHENIEFEFNNDGGKFTLPLSDSSTVLEKDVDYAYITLEQDTLNLDTVHVPPGYVITGVRLNHVTPRDGLSPIQLEIHATPFNYQTGELLQSEGNPSIWITSMTSSYHPREDQIKRQKINYGRSIYNKDQSIYHEISLMSNRYVQFRRSSVYYDAGQSTVPFFDTRPASVIERIPLDGMAIIYRENSDYAGFLTLKMHGIDTSQSLRPGIKNEDLKLYRENYNTKLAYKPVVI